VPRVLLAAGDGLDQTAYGDTWFYFERELDIPVTPVNLSDIERIDLGDYNVLIVPATSEPGRAWRELGEDGAERLRTWVRSGGVVVASGGAVALLARKEVGLATLRAVGDSADSAGAGAKDSTAARDTTVSASARPAPPLVSPKATAGLKPEYVPGAIFRATLDRSHWLTFGYERDELPVLLETGTLLQPSARGDNPVAFVGSELTLSGFTWPGNTERLLRGSVWAAVERVGAGQVVLFAENPLYRGFWRGTARLLTNAVLFGPGR
jgi:hypothetical protein